MKKIDVIFTNNNEIGNAVLTENLITDEIILKIYKKLTLGEVAVFINKAIDLLKNKYDKIKVKTHWRTILEEDK